MSAQESESGSYSAASTLRITEIFFSLQGESRTVGVPTVFVRLTGCPLRCTYCDTAYAFSGGNRRSIAQIVEQVERFPTSTVTVTGGEPLAQPACSELLRVLCDSGASVSLETSGALPVEQVDSRVSIVMDIKTPSSGESAKNLLSNLEALTAKDQIKFVIGSKDDYQWSKEMLIEHDLSSICDVFFSPVFGQMSDVDLADWILADGLPVRFQFQLHKHLWGDEPGR